MPTREDDGRFESFILYDILNERNIFKSGPLHAFVPDKHHAAPVAVVHHVFAAEKEPDARSISPRKMAVEVSSPRIAAGTGVIFLP